ncbi:MAG TPA: methyltransferase domain-containing protein [Candidatus Binatia bacterium]|nr:methyltransferase domain-containing protein [Candidatus Binatia bacterium]
MKNTNFINPEKVLFQAGLKTGQTVGDLGAGSGFYAIAAGKIVGPHGMVHVADIKESALDHVMAEARVHNMNGIRTYLCDLSKAKLSGNFPEGECDMVIMTNIIHEIEDKKNLLVHAYRMLKTGGRLVIVDWNSTPGPIGPAADKRVNENEVKKLVESSSLKYLKNLDTDPFHFGMVFEK